MIPGVDTSKLTNVRRVQDGWLCGCPICAQEGRDSKKAHLKIFDSGKFFCVGYGDDKEHNRKIYNCLYGNSEPEEFIESLPRPKLDRIYPESMLSQLLPDHSYWVGRGIGENTMNRFEGGVAPNERGKLKGYYVFPCRNAKKQLCGFAGRLIEDNYFSPRWKILGPKKTFLFNHVAHPAIISSREVILVEGIGCCLALTDVGIEHVLPLMGLNVSSTIICYLAPLSLDRIIIATNNEASGIGNKAAEKLKTVLDKYFDNVIIYLPPVKDFLDCDRSQRELWAVQAGIKRT